MTMRPRQHGQAIGRNGDWFEGFKTLRLMPLKGMPSGFKNAWPPYMVEWEDLLAQQE
jgi:hypothetical protein